MDPTAQKDTQNIGLPKDAQTLPQNPQGTQTDINPSETTLNQNPLQYSQINQTPPLQPAQQNQTAPVPQATAIQNQPPGQAMTEIPGKKSKKPLFFLFFLFLLTALLAGLGGLTYAVAYEKIKLDKYPDVQKKVSAFVMNLPFAPKTAKFLLAQSALAHQDVTKQSFDISAAIDSADISSSLGLTNLDIQAKGAFDYTDPRNISGNLEFSFTKDLNFELRKKDEMLYFKINKLPAFLFAFMGIGTPNLDPIIDKWVAHDTTPMDTEARKSIQQDKEIDPLSEEFIDKNFDKYLDEEILSKMQLSSDIEEGHSVYKITLNADKDLIDHLGMKIEESSRQKSNYAYPQNTSGQDNKLSDFIKELKWEMYIDKESYYTRKVILSMNIDYDKSDSLGIFSIGSITNSISPNNSAKIALAAKFDKFGEEVVVEAPPESITFEEFTNLISQTFKDIYGDETLLSMNRDIVNRDIGIKNDINQIRNGLKMYEISCNKYPEELSDLTDAKKSDGCHHDEVFLSTIPTDPQGEDYYYIAGEDGGSYDLCAKLEIPQDTEITCPDPSYNYHFSSAAAGSH